MDFTARFTQTFLVFLFTTTTGSLIGPSSYSSGGQLRQIQFDIPGVTVAHQRDRDATGRVVSMTVPISSLVVESPDASPVAAPPVEHVIVRCRLRGDYPVADYSPRTELASDFAGAISINEKRETTDSFGLSLNGAVPYAGSGHLGADDQTKHSDTTQFERQPPMKAIIASGTTDRGRGVYFKYRWTSGQVLEGEKRIEISFVVPPTWRGGILDIQVTAAGRDRSLFGNGKLRTVFRQDFVVATYQEHDPEAANLSIRLARLDQRLARYAQRLSASGGNPVVDWWKKFLGEQTKTDSDWYLSVKTTADEEHLQRILADLPAPVIETVAEYNETHQLLEALNEADRS